jgi:hypothetical protein
VRSRGLLRSLCSLHLRDIVLNGIAENGIKRCKGKEGQGQGQGQDERLAIEERAKTRRRRREGIKVCSSFDRS